ncbi:enolase C-terminal domain-like protein [uncultured Hyphomonas sp.]|uniref:enolase C-terminal domain-like protein n=1 Tax=uncultured Hyphomonas sp. TaxID=225298 RepID=UPI002AAA9A7F|nr:enolase C-terminal domain-like protein [uncultured Hyphomonas sp.]
MITGIEARDIRFPTSRHFHGSDAMNPDPDYSCAYATLRMKGGDPDGNGLTFTIGRGNDLCVAAIEGLGRHLIGRQLDEFEEDLGLASRLLLNDSQYRWLGPEKGVVHLAAAALINAVWDALAKRAAKPLWRYVSEMAPERIVSAIDFRHMSDYLTEAEAMERLQQQAGGRAARTAELLRDGYPAYTTSAGWIGYTDEEIVRRLNAAYAEGWRHFKIKVGGDLNGDLRRCKLFRDTLGPDVRLSVDANQVWDVADAVTAIRAMAPYDIYWVEEPTSPDDVLGHKAIAEQVAPVLLATGEHAHNRVMFKQFLQAGAIGFCQIDSCRLAGVNEVLAVMMMADKAGVPVCPHAGGVGLCEYVQHLSMIDYVCISGTMEGRVIEHAAHLHQHFINPIETRNGRYIAPSAPGYSVDLYPESIADHEFPHGKEWAAEAVS